MQMIEAKFIKWLCRDFPKMSMKDLKEHDLYIMEQCYAMYKKWC